MDEVGGSDPDAIIVDGVVIGGTVGDIGAPIDGDVSDDGDGEETAGAASEDGCVGGCDGGDVSDSPGVVGGVVEHPATNKVSVTMDASKIGKGRDMEWILLEAAIALGIGIFIAWWLMRGKDRSPRDR